MASYPKARSPRIFLLTLMLHKISLWSAVLAVPPPSFLRTPNLLTEGAEWGKRENLNAVHTLRSTNLCYLTLFYS